LLIELGIVGIIGYILFFISVNVNPTLGSIYTLPLVLGISLALVDYFFGSKSIKLFNKNVSWFQAFAWGIGGYIAVILSAQLASIFAEVIPLTELLSLLGATAPIFSQSSLLNVFSFGFLLAFIETYTFFVIALDILCSMFNVEINKRSLSNPKMWLIIFGLSLLFLLYHITAKGIENEVTLILVFFMAVISLITLVYTQDARPALILHILANSIAATSIFVIVPKVILPLVGGG